MVLKDTPPDTFKRVLIWLYTGDYEPAPAPLAESNEDDEKGENQENEHKEVNTPAKMDSPAPRLDSSTSYDGDLDMLDKWIHGAIDDYSFAEKYDVPELRQCIMKAWQACALSMSLAKWVPDDSMVLKAYDRLHEQSLLLKHITSWFAYEYNFTVYGTSLSSFPRDFLEEIIKTISARLPSRFSHEKVAPWENWCDYHEHKTGLERSVCEGQHQRAQLLQMVIANGEEEVDKLNETWFQTPPPNFTSPELNPPGSAPQPYHTPPHHHSAPKEEDAPKEEVTYPRLNL
ncbi:hypothetical protein BU16DRAFT_331553 [Lophium mytilinum]|uniref:BTB domain-containing protein n=1 Tax=Lophium mytilinum TaxID=390894 RepID=A0A6A6R3M2_9PEZI|nr:hypothetical protein BU16DRAFT_331553 [Lophium mytilinum]